MTGSPFSNVLGSDPGSSSFHNVEPTQVGDSTDSDRVGVDADTESSLGVEVDGSGVTHVATEDETAEQSDLSGTPTPL